MDYDAPQPSVSAFPRPTLGQAAGFQPPDTIPMTFWMRAKSRAERGALIGIQWGTALLIVAFALSWLLTNYALVSSRAANGQAAFEYIQRVTQQQQQQKAAEKPATP